MQEKRELQEAVDKLKEGSEKAKEALEMLENAPTTILIRKTSGVNKYREIDQTILLNPDAASINPKTPFIIVVAHESFHAIRHVFANVLSGFPTKEAFALMGENGVRKDLGLPNRDRYECVPGYRDC
ncbi:MAG: hypothetical protein R1F54_00320 [Candidatus Zeuxoniibacter abyssi]|nr:MAG: hypothetical protein R1F54_00320 [Candidatus Persebacteraceae bacterium AB1(2)]